MENAQQAYTSAPGWLGPRAAPVVEAVQRAEKRARELASELASRASHYAKVATANGPDFAAAAIDSAKLEWKNRRRALFEWSGRTEPFRVPLEIKTRLECALRQLQACLSQVEEHVLRHQALQLRDYSQEETAQLWAGLRQLAAEVERLPGPAVATLAFLVLRLLTTFNALCDALVVEVLTRRTWLGSIGSGIGLLAAGSPGWYLAYRFRRVILKDVAPTATELSANAGNAGVQVMVKLLRNVRQLPPGFWCASIASTMLSLRVVQMFSIGTVRAVLRLQWRSMVLLTLGAVAARAAQQGRLAELPRPYVEQLPPGVARAVSTTWYELQAISRRSWSAAVAAAERSRRHLPKRVDADASRAREAPAVVLLHTVNEQEKFNGADAAHAMAANPMPVFSGPDTPRSRILAAAATAVDAGAAAETAGDAGRDVTVAVSDR